METHSLQPKSADNRSDTNCVEESIDLEENYTVIPARLNTKFVKDAALHPARLPLIPPDSADQTFKVFHRKYWASPVESGKNSFSNWSNFTETQLINFLQIVPDNYVWILRYFA